MRYSPNEYGHTHERMQQSHGIEPAHMRDLAIVEFLHIRFFHEYETRRLSHTMSEAQHCLEDVCISRWGFSRSISILISNAHNQQLQNSVEVKEL